jgi:hypothetical protein
MMIAADTSLSMSIGGGYMPVPASVAHAAPPAPGVANASQPRVVAAAPAAAMAPAPPPPLVHDSLLATYDGHHPEHVAGEPYFGRYTYVVLAGSGPTDPRNRALVAALVAKYGVGANGGTQTVLANPYGYNIFFLPVNEPRDATAVSNTTDALLAAYDFKAANNLRLRYCSEAAHSATSICTKPLANGPFMLTFARPLNSLRKHEAFPPAYGYDLSLVGPDQYGPAVAIVARATSVPEAMQADVMLPPADLTKYVGPTFVASAAALRLTVPTMKVYPDAALNG